MWKGSTGRDRAGQGETGQGETGQGETGQDETGQDETGQDRKPVHGVTSTQRMILHHACRRGKHDWLTPANPPTLIATSVQWAASKTIRFSTANTKLQISLAFCEVAFCI